jgi:hypothetical protein
MTNRQDAKEEAPRLEINFLLPGSGKRKAALSKTASRFWTNQKLCA